MKILVTGGTGFVGSWLQRTQDTNDDVTYIGRKDYGLWRWEVAHWDAIVHLANVSPARAIQAAQTSRCRLLYCSSGAVYGQQTDYAKNKRKWEYACFTSHIDAVSARLFTFYGSARSHLAFVEAAQAGAPLVITGDGTTTRSYMHGDELGKWMWTILYHGKTGSAYDVGSDEPMTMVKLARQVIQEYNSPSQIIIQGGVDAVPYYVPKHMDKTRKLVCPKL